MKNLVTISRTIEFDAGHRIPSHASKCRNLHGHRYKVMCAVTGPVMPVRKETDDAMVMDFGVLKGIMMEEIHDKLDHRFLIHEGDPLLPVLDVDSMPDCLVVVPFVPTAEELARYIFTQVEARIMQFEDCRLAKVMLWETPNCYAIVKG